MFRNQAHSKRPSVGPGTADAIDALLDAMRAEGIETDEPHKIAANTGKKYCRFHVIGDKKGSRNGLARLYVDQYGARGSFGSNKTGVIRMWHMDDDVQMTPAERRERMEAIERQKRQHEKELQRQQALAAKRAERIWREAKPCTAHPYLARKQVGAHGLRLWRDALVIPARDVTGKLWTLEFVRADGSKKFLSDGRKIGNYFSIGRLDGKSGYLLVCEGFATGASLYEAKRKPVAVAFDAGNLLAVVEALHKKYPGVRIIVCADNDVNLPDNPGRTKGKAAAEAIGASAVIPADDYNDFNDMAVAGVPVQGVPA
jgi:putative DNA primase/helicase